MRGHWDRMGTGGWSVRSRQSSATSRMLGAGRHPLHFFPMEQWKSSWLCVPTESPDCSLGALCIHPGEEPERRAAHPGQSPAQAGNSVRSISVATFVPGPSRADSSVLACQFLPHPGARCVAVRILGPREAFTGRSHAAGSPDLVMSPRCLPPGMWAPPATLEMAGVTQGCLTRPILEERGAQVVRCHWGQLRRAHLAFTCIPC